jgi:hypothetical protein
MPNPGPIAAAAGNATRQADQARRDLADLAAAAQADSDAPRYDAVAAPLASIADLLEQVADRLKAASPEPREEPHD